MLGMKHCGKTLNHISDDVVAQPPTSKREEDVLSLVAAQCGLIRGARLPFGRREPFF
jgi:hypothetical protein